MTFRGLGTFRALVVGISRNSNRKMNKQILGDVHNEEPLLGLDVFVVLREHSNGDFQLAV